MSDNTKKDIASFITFALASANKTVTVHQHFDEKGNAVQSKTKVDLGTASQLMDHEIAEIDTLMKKYETVKELMPQGKYLDKLDLAEFKGQKIDTGLEHSNTKIRDIRISESQVKLAKEIAKRVQEIYELHSAGKKKPAQEKYDEYRKFLTKQRKALYGDFETIGEIGEIMGMPGTGSNTSPQLGILPLVVFVGVEIWVG